MDRVAVSEPKASGIATLAGCYQNWFPFIFSGVLVFILFLRMDYRIVSAGLGVVCLVLAAYVLVGGTVETQILNSTVYPVEDLMVYYLYPVRCVDCDLRVPGECDYCTSYYDDRLMDLISQEVGAPVQFEISDAVNRPGVFVVYRDQATLGDARTRYNIAHTICTLSGLEKSCELFASELKRVRECVQDFGVEEDAIIYHTSSVNCPVCSATDGIIEDLKDLEYDDNIGYEVKTVDHAVKEERKILTDCMRAFDNIEYAPQLLCPKVGKELTGQFSLSQAREFADQCIEAR